MTVAVFVAAVVLAAVAAAGLLRPWTRPGRRTLERLTDPLEDERGSLLRSLRDLDEERATGVLTHESYALLRAETERRAVAVLRALQGRDGSLAADADTAVDVADLRSLQRAAPSTANGHVSSPATPPRRRMLVALAVAAAVLAVLVPVLAHSVTSRSAGGPITGTLPTPADPLAYFEQRVTDHPNDLAARLDLAQRFLQTGNVRGAIAQYVAALRIDPQDPDARATLGFLLFRAGRPQESLQAIQQALAIDPKFPEALYYEGIVELQGIHDANAATAAFEAYLKAAPFGSHVAEVRQYLQEAASPSPIPSG
jgi:cytochrome c-type biogenesis protein CcmH/NrfG